ncbi:MAG TPA: lactate utilization protein C [Blastocatellia bacterium]|nr:lactate utilization protein C [Blastocatellia bacterium]
MTARDEILSKVRQALGNRHAAHSAGLPDDIVPAPPPLAPLSEHERDTLVEQFAVALARVGGGFSVAASAQEVGEQIAGIAAQVKSRKAVGWHSPWFEQLGLMSRLAEMDVELITDRERPDKAAFINEAAEAGLGVTAVDYALADSGTLCLLAGKTRPRTASLLPPVHVAILRPEQILRGLDDLFTLLPADDRLSSAVTLITGPSRTADIELTLVVGVHGPQQLHVILADWS